MIIPFSTVLQIVTLIIFSFINSYWFKLFKASPPGPSVYEQDINWVIKYSNEWVYSFYFILLFKNASIEYLE